MLRRASQPYALSQFAIRVQNVIRRSGATASKFGAIRSAIRSAPSKLAKLESKRAPVKEVHDYGDPDIIVPESSASNSSTVLFEDESMSDEARQRALHLVHHNHMPAWLARNCVTKLGVSALLPIQDAAWKPIAAVMSSDSSASAANPDLLIQAPTGSGKTLSYVLPILASTFPNGPPSAPPKIETAGVNPRQVRRLQRRAAARAGGLRGIIVVPSRELAIQVFAQAQALLSSSTENHSSVKLLLPGAGMHQRAAAIASPDDPTALLITTASPLLHLLSDPSFMSAEDRKEVDAFWAKQRLALQRLRENRPPREPSRGPKRDDDDEDDADAVVEVAESEAKPNGRSFRSRGAGPGMMLDSEIKLGQVTALLDDPLDDEHLPPSPAQIAEFRTAGRGPRPASWPASMTRVPFGQRRAPTPHQTMVERREKRRKRAAWARLEALALTTNVKLLKNVKAIVLDEPDALLQPPHPHASTESHKQRRHHPLPAQMILQRIFSAQHRLSESESDSSAAAARGPRLICVSATISALMRLYIHRTRSLFRSKLPLPPSQRTKLVLPPGAERDLEAERIAQTLQSGWQSADSEDLLTSGAAGTLSRVMLDPNSEAALERSLQEDAALELLPEEHDTHDQSVPVSEDQLDEQPIGPQDWFRGDAVTANDEQTAQRSEQATRHRYLVPEQIQHKFIVCDELGKIGALMQLVESYRSAAALFTQALSAADQSAAPHVPAVLAVLPDSAPIDKVVTALNARGLRVIPAHRGLLTPLAAQRLISDSASGEAIVGAGSDAAAIETSGMPEHLSRRADFLQQLQRGDVDIVVTTESTARGLDLPGTLLCVLCVMPYQPRDYVHLAGRVGRSHTVTEGAISQLTTLPGICVSLVSDRELHRCIPRHALSLQLDFESWSISANESKSARPGRDAAALISAAQQPLVQPQLVPSFLHLMRSALLPNASRLVEAATSMSNVKQSGSSAPSLRKLLMSLPAPATAGAVVSGSALRLAARAKAVQRAQRRHSRFRDEIKSKIAAPSSTSPSKAAPPTLHAEQAAVTL